MKKYITLNIVHPNNIEGDSEGTFDASIITVLVDATVLDKKHRAETKTIMYMVNGQCYGLTQTREEILQMIEEASM